MASFTASFKDYVGGANGKSLIMARGTLVLGAGEGGTTGDIPASLFGLNKIYSVTPAIKSDDSQVALFAVGKDSDELFATNIEQATDANRANPADLAGSWILTVIGS